MSSELVMQYPKYQSLVHKTILSVHASIGGDIEEMFSMAGTLYMQACQTYKPERGVFPSHVRKVTWDDTYALRRTEIRRDQRMDREVDLLTVPAKPAGFDLAEFTSSLSDEARRLLDLALDPPDDVMRTKEGLPKQNSLFACAKRLFGWTAEQIAETVSEIQSAL